jgi:LPS export ABC transporter protein LptC
MTGRPAPRRPRRRALGVALALALAPAAGSACADVESPAARSVTANAILDSADQVAFGFRTTITDRGVLRAEVYADTALFLDQNTRASLRVVNADFYGATGSKEATMVARIANFNTRTQQLDAWGDVVITSVDGRVLKSEMVRYVQSLNQVSSDSAFVLTEPGRKEVQGIGFRADPNLTFVDVLRLQRARGGTVDVPGA